MNIMQQTHTNRNIAGGLLIFFLLIAATAMGQVKVQGEEPEAPADTIDRLAPDFVTSSICIVDPTDWHDDMLGVMGHAFIRLQCPTYDLDYCYSYEGESANKDITGFLMGDLKMGLVAIPTTEYLQPFRRWNRTVREYTLNLPPEAETRLWEIMDRHLEDGMDLPLDLTEHGCTQTLVEYITQALDTTEIKYGEWPEEYQLTRTEIIDESLLPYPWLRLMAKCLGMYGDFDKDCTNEEKIILPRQIEEVWMKAKVNGLPLLTYKGRLTEGESPVVERPWFTPTVAGIMLLVMAASIIFLLLTRRKKKVQ